MKHVAGCFTELDEGVTKYRAPYNSKFHKDKLGLAIYIRCFVNGAASHRYEQALCAAKRLGLNARGLVISNIEINSDLQRQGFFTLLESRLWTVAGLDVIEVENVVNEGLAKHLVQLGFQSREDQPLWPSLFKLA